MLVTNIEQVSTTRDRLVAIALDLFERDGFAATPVSHIAARAGVTEMTFYRLCGSKAAAVVEDPFDPLIAAAVAARPPTEAPLARVAAGLRDAWAGQDSSIDASTARRIRIIARSPELSQASWRATEGTRDAIVATLVTDGVPDSSARIATVACLAALHTALLDAVAEDAARPIRGMAGVDAPASVDERLRAALSVLIGDDS